MGATASVGVGAWLLAARADLAALVDRNDFATVFQPIVRLCDGHAVGFEALTRFGHRATPTQVFEAAARCGLGTRLELATMERALAAASQLPAGTWVSVNVSTRTLGHTDDVQRLLADADRPVVLELTEHEPVDDYAMLRRALHAMGDVRLAIDDTGSGFASLRHVMELRPAFIKADRVWVHGAAQDPCRRAIVSGLRSLAESTGGELIVEGVERACDRAALSALGVSLAQGFLLGEPADASTYS